MNVLRQARPALGTIVDIALTAADPVIAKVAMQAAFVAIEEAELVFSVHRPESECMRLSTSGHLAPFRCSEQMIDLLRTSLDLHRESEGIFDIAVGSGGSSADIELDDDGRVSFRAPLRLNFGGIAKGHAIDRAVEALKQHGALCGVANAGGDLRAFGDADEPVALRFEDGLRVVAHLRNGAFAASRITPEPKTGKQNGSWSNAPGAHRDGRDSGTVARTDTIAVFAPTATIADALTKVALVSSRVADKLCAQHDAQWRALPFHIVPTNAADEVRNAA